MNPPETVEEKPGVIVERLDGVTDEWEDAGCEVLFDTKQLHVSREVGTNDKGEQLIQTLAYYAEGRWVTFYVKGFEPIKTRRQI